MGDDVLTQKKKRDFFLDIIKQNDDLWKEGVPNFDVVQVPILQLSADQTVNDWMQLAYLIEKNYHQYTGFVISHGTDTVVYIATALSFMLENLGKPVIFTGSLIPAECIYTDMKRNLILSLMVANCRQLTEVCILFDDTLYRANRCLKVSRSNLKPYDSPHYPPLAVMEGSMRLIGPLLRPQPHGKLRVMPNMETKILSLELGPCTPLDALLLAVEKTEAKAVVLACYGSGNGPSRGNFMPQLIQLAKSRNLLVVITTQNRYGGVNLSEYELGRKLLDLGAVSAGNMTQEATFIKLKYLFGLGLSADTVRSYLTKDLRGEISTHSPKL
uniref:asparaginase n=1 Tax=Strigomonas galati TaxID=1003336 RepID=U5KN13_9TRYP|nr:asparaginase [Strigomonas galati]